MLKTVQDHPGYAEAVATLERLEEGQTALLSEQSEIWARNKHGSNRQGGASFQQQALDALEGKASEKGMWTADHQRLGEIAATLQLLSLALHRQPLEIEFARTAARAHAIAERKADVAAIRKAWEAAREAMAAALSAENALIDSLIEGGFGRHHPAITSPQWLNRGHAMRDLGVTPRFQ